MYSCNVTMLGTPKNINFLAVKKDLIAIEGVEQAHTLNIWSISSTRTALAGHIVIRKLNYIQSDVSYPNPLDVNSADNFFHNLKNIELTIVKFSQ